MKHTVKIKVAYGGKEQQVLSSCNIRLPIRLLRWIFGGSAEILVLALGKTVQDVEIQEVAGVTDFSS